ncbi:ectonucleotide pyrophosphatase/phosphodiesterase family member 7-like [Notothenia coriiceps]|uniref:Ectonucleotide pyrophosphatase/phosphodiesterase family member 7-like n=1 Tax=Notothenia coriiceps TaxID=8208 RepID=A0A6I9PSA9_9TELE|nr:PREDICTED: ectonucleotide pyrophosphatase/phosphodiesterase family member 7-like [Notothenia coriiceps]
MDMKPFFRAVGPEFHKNLEVGPFETVNIYALMCHILGIKPEVNDGHLNATKHMLVSNTTTQGEDVDVLNNIFNGLAAVAGFLVVVFIMVTSHKLLKDKRKNKRSVSSDQLPAK